MSCTRSSIHRLKRDVQASREGRRPSMRSARFYALFGADPFMISVGVGPTEIAKTIRTAAAHTQLSAGVTAQQALGST